VAHDGTDNPRNSLRNGDRHRPGGLADLRAGQRASSALVPTAWIGTGQDEVRLEGWATTLRNLNLSDKVGVLYTGRHCRGTPVSEFVVLTYSAGPRHRKLVTV